MVGVRRTPRLLRAEPDQDDGQAAEGARAGQGAGEHQQHPDARRVVLGPRRRRHRASRRANPPNQVRAARVEPRRRWRLTFTRGSRGDRDAPGGPCPARGSAGSARRTRRPGTVPPASVPPSGTPDSSACRGPMSLAKATHRADGHRDLQRTEALRSRRACGLAGLTDTTSVGPGKEVDVDGRPASELASLPAQALRPRYRTHDQQHSWEDAPLAATPFEHDTQRRRAEVHER